MVLNQDYLTHLGSTHGGIRFDTIKGCGNNVEMPNILQGMGQSLATKNCPIQKTNKYHT